jgi:protein TonB
MLRQPALPLPLSGPRIAGTSAAVALHAIALMLLFTPTTWSPPEATATVEDLPTPVDFPVIKTVLIAPPPVAKPQTPVHKAAVAKPVVAQAQPVESNSGPQSTDSEILPSDFGNTETIDAPVAELSADVAPTPTYPLLALRAGTTGLVLLRIEVDASGHPVAGSIEKSSGSRLLDQAALKFVLARWHFNPAIRAGAPVQAVALVPISFTLD